MADVAAKREARRRRILENSEYRLQKITGHANGDVSTEERNKKAIETQSNASSSDSNGILTNETIMQGQTFDSLINEINANIDADEPSEKPDQIYAATQELLNHVFPRQNILHRRNPERSYVSNECDSTEYTYVHSPENARYHQDQQDSHAGSPIENSERDVPVTSSSTFEQSSVAIVVLSSRLVYVILAIVVNIMIFLKLEHLFGTSIVVPFFAVMFGRLWTCKNEDGSQSNNMLVAALILSNCRPEFVKFIQRLKDIISLFGKISRDLAVYIFTFVLFYSVMSPCVNYSDDSLSLHKSAEAIFTDEIVM